MNKIRYFHPRLALSYKRPYTFIVGVRGVGKTYSMTKFLVKKALETHSLYFMWLRVAKTELDNCKNEFFSDMEKDNCFPNYTFRVVGNYGYAKDLTTHEEFAICYFNFIKASQDIKGTPLPTIQYIVCDEFIEESTSPYKKMLIDTFSICESVFRLRRVKCIFLGNAVTMENVFFKYFKIKDINRPFTKGKQYVVENTAYEDIYKGYMKAHEESNTNPFEINKPKVVLSFIKTEDKIYDFITLNYEQWYGAFINEGGLNKLAGQILSELKTAIDNYIYDTISTDLSDESKFTIKHTLPTIAGLGDSGSASWYWLRSPRSDHSNIFCGVTSGGNWDYYSASNSNGVSLAFCI